MSQKRALILGINGQDGSYLAEILLANGYEVHGVVRRNSQPNLWRLNGCIDHLILHQGDLLDPQGIDRIIGRVRPTEIYNEADQDHVGFSGAAPKLSVDVTYGGIASLLEMLKGNHTIKLFQPLSATMFGNAPAPQSLETPFDPQSPYAVSKVAAYYLCKHYREKHGIFVSTAILYNHDSVRRQGDYLLHKICKGVVKIHYGDQKSLDLTNLQAKVDIGYAKDYMEAVYQRMQLDHPTDCLIGTGNPETIHSLIRMALNYEGVIYDPYLWLTNQNDQYDTRHKTEQCLSPSVVDNFLQVTKPVQQLIRDICEHYSTQLYGGK